LQQDLIIEEVREELSRQRSMEVAAWVSTSNVRSTISADSTNSLGSSSLDTASASAHLESYDVPSSFLDTNGNYMGLRPRRSRSYAAFIEWNTKIPGVHRHHKSIRPLGGASRRLLITQIQQLTKDKADLQAQLEAIVLRGGTDASIGSTGTNGTRSSKRSSQRQSDKKILHVDGIDGEPPDRMDGNNSSLGETIPTLEASLSSSLDLETVNA
jgi:hypothetical protein